MSRDKSSRVREAASGWLEIEITGEHTERLLNLALQQGLNMHHIRRLGERNIRARLLLTDIYALRPLLSASRCRFRVVKRAGWPFMLAHARRRAGLIIGGLLFALALYLSCSVIWQVEVESIYPISAAQRGSVLTLAGQAGLKPGTPSWGLDLAGISQYIITEASDFIFVQVERQGVKALIHVVRRIDVVGGDLPLPPGEIVAMADGLIEQILVRSGVAAVAPGATVKAGDVLVYGLSGEKIIAASALITARVWSEGEGEWPLKEAGLRPSGQNARGLSLRFGNGESAPSVIVAGEKAAPYTHFTHLAQVYDVWLWRNIPLPVELILDTWYEQQPYATSYTKEQALYHAERQAASRALENLPRGCDLLSQKAVELAGDVNRVRLRVICEARADIGQFTPLTAQSMQRYEQMLQEARAQVKQ